MKEKDNKIKMSFTLELFQNWLSYSSWEELKGWLTSEAGGNLRVVDPNGSPYAVVRYWKDKSDFTKSHVSWCRSVVVEKASRLPVCVSPPRSSTWSVEAMDSIVSAEEFLDGTMINVFRVAKEGAEPCLATRSRIGGVGKFYQNGETFDAMMKQTLEAKGISLESLLPTDAPEGTVASFTSLVLQHPSNRIVKAVAEPTYHVIHRGFVNAQGHVTIQEVIDSARTLSLSAIRGFKSVEDWVAFQAKARGFGWQGVVLKDGTGKRYRFRSAVYETVRQIRGNESSLEERFARLRKTQMMSQYTIFYPEERTAMFELEGNLRKNTRQLSLYYDAVFRAHTVLYAALPWPYKHHVSVLHNLYKEKLRAQKKKVTLEEVMRYVNEDLNVEDLANMSRVHKHELREVKPREVAATEAVATEAVATEATEATA